MTEQPRDHPSCEPLRALGGRKAVTIACNGKPREAEPGLTQGVDACQQDRVRGELRLTPYRPDHVMLTPAPTSPLERHRHLFTLALHIDGDALEQQPHDLLAVFGGGGRSMPEPGDLVGEAPDRVTVSRCQLGGPLLPEACISFLLVLLLPESLCPPFFQLPCYQAVCRLHGSILTRRPLHRVARSLQPLLPMPLELRSFGSQGLFGRSTHLS